MATGDADATPFVWTGARLKEAIDAKGITQSQLADEIGVKKATVGKWIRGMEPSASRLLRAAAVLDVAPDWLCGVEEDALSGVTRRIPPDLRDRAASTLRAAFEPQIDADFTPSVGAIVDAK